MKKDILKLEQDQSPVNLEHSTEDIDREIKQKGIDMHYQWRKRKLNFQKLPHT